MSAAQRVPVILTTLTAGALSAVLAAMPSLRLRLARLLHLESIPLPFTSSTLLKVLALLFALTNLKSLPFVWHWRVLRGILYQMRLNPHKITGRDLFKPMVTSSWNSLLDTDYNLHKSNSTYFADFDVARAHLVGALLRTGVERLNSGDSEGLPDSGTEGAQSSGRPSRRKNNYMLALGGVACVFRKEVKPFERFDIHTRVLCWDRKWIYIVSHMVRRGSVTPRSYTLQPWKKPTKTDKERPKAVIFASSIAKYVLKKGRLTIAPEVVLERSRLLPPRSEALRQQTRADGNGVAGLAVPQAPLTANGSSSPASLTSPEYLGFAAEVSAKLSTGDSEAQTKEEALQRSGEEGTSMTWDEVEAERLRGLKIAEQFEGLTALHDEFGRDEDVLGEYGDWLW